MYDPTLGRFISRDPIDYRSGVNLYEYCGDDPLTYTDPTGLSKGGKKCIKVTGVPSNATAAHLEKLIAEAKACGASPKHIRALEGLLKVTKRNVKWAGPIGIMICILFETPGVACAANEGGLQGVGSHVGCEIWDAAKGIAITPGDGVAGSWLVRPIDGTPAPEPEPK